MEPAKPADPDKKKKRAHGRLGTLRHAAAAQRGEAEDQLALLPDNNASPKSKKKFNDNAGHNSMPPEQDGSWPANQLPTQLPGAVDNCAAPPLGRVLDEDAAHATAPREGASSSADEHAAPHVIGRVFRPEAAHASVPGEDSPRTAEQKVRLQVERSLALAQQSDEVPLPMGWEMHRNEHGREFYVNARAGISQWTAPRLPAHWEERLSSDGRIYYLSLFDGHTQWHWPHEASELARQQQEQPQLLALPGSTISQPLALPAPPEPGHPYDHLAGEDSESEESEASLGQAVDKIDAGVLLCLDVEGISRSSTPAGTPRDGTSNAIPGIIAVAPEPTCKAARIAKLPKWGEDNTDVAWQKMQEKLAEQARAHHRRHYESKSFPGLREFVHTHELHDQVNQWDKQFENAHEKLDNIDRRGKLLGYRAECTKEDLRVTFPIIQRLQWTFWPAYELFVHTMARDMPTWHMFVNVARPTKFQRCTLHLLFLAVALLGSTLMLAFEAPISEDINALDVPFWTLCEQVFTVPFDGRILGVAIFADIVARFVEALCARVFFGYSLPRNKRPPMNENDRIAQLMLWHQMADFGKWVCTLGTVICVAGAVTLCAQFPQPRSASVVRALLLGTLWAYVCHPMLKGLVATIILDVSRTLPVFDGLLTVMPDIMDFRATGVHTPQFLSWRVEKIVSEMELMRRLHKEPPEIGGPTTLEDDSDED